MTDDIVGQALAYAAAGWPVFPCRPGAKVPAIPSAHPAGAACKGECGRDGHGFHDATTGPDRIRAWWQRWPDANVGIATGAPGPDVLDVDKHEDGDGFAAFNRLKRAGMLTGARALVRTRSGGLHAYFTGTGQQCGRLPAHHLDFKSRGGYVLAPPSEVGGRQYALLDHRGGADGRLDWQAVRRLLDPPRMPARPRGRAAGDLGTLAAWVAAQREGNRNDGLFWAACSAAEAGHGDLDDLVAAAVQAGLSEADARRTVASAARKVAAR